MQITTIGLDIAKNVFQVHGIGADEKVVVRRGHGNPITLRRSSLPAALRPCGRSR
jgi:transposase